VSATVPLDAPPALRAPAVATCGGGGDDRVRAVTARLEAGTLRVACSDGVEVVRPARWLRAGDGRDAIDVVLRPCGRTLTVTWRDGRRGRYSVATLRA
jgi:hypothetical protein